METKHCQLGDLVVAAYDEAVKVASEPCEVSALAAAAVGDLLNCSDAWNAQSSCRDSPQYAWH
jgi:hypothetical protein